MSILVNKNNINERIIFIPSCLVPNSLDKIVFYIGLVSSWYAL